MKTRHLLILFLLTCCNCVAFGAQIDSIPWTDANIEKLDRSSKAAVAKFVNGLGDPNLEVLLNPYRISGFEWLALAGNGRSELVVVTYWPATSWTTIYWRERSGKVDAQALRGETSLKNGIKDLDGDGKKEIIKRSLCIRISISREDAEQTPLQSGRRFIALKARSTCPRARTIRMSTS